MVDGITNNPTEISIQYTKYNISAVYCDMRMHVTIRYRDTQKQLQDQKMGGKNA